MATAQDKTTDSLKKLAATMRDDSAKADVLLQISRSYFNVSWEDAINYSNEAKALSEKISYNKGVALAWKNIGIAHYFKGTHLEAIDAWQQSLATYEKMQDKSGIANILGNLGGIYERSDPTKALDYYLRSMRLAEEIGDEFRIATLSLNIAALYDKKPATEDKALESYRRAISLSEKNNYPDALGMATGNMGDLFLKKGMVDSALHYFKLAEKKLQGNPNLPLALNNIGKAYLKHKQYDSAFVYHRQAYNESVQASNKLYMAQALLGLAEIYAAQGDNKLALAYYRQAEPLAAELNANDELNRIYHGLSVAYSHSGKYNQAYDYQVKLTQIKENIYNKEADDKLKGLQFEFDLQKKEAQIDLLSRDKELQVGEIKRQRLVRNALLGGIALIIAIAFMIYRNYRAKVKTNLLLDRQKDEIEHLLLNILPAEVAHELQEQGAATPKYFEQASVLFTDFKGFTRMADHMSPQELVAELNECFMAFDEIIERNHLEKIKTIGDSYMCAGGIPTPDPAHVLNMVNASFQILEYLDGWNRKRQENNLVPWHLRIGIHVGPLVAGVVGRKKYAYDIWGSTVNIASRMESAGEPGQVNISSSTYELIRDYYECSYRGKISAKNIDEIDMYFVVRKKHAESHESLAKAAS
ncbi:hypothetical protein OI18_04500 [Flavihumibacter solisilvae]|uniref:Guanylate cyclase domain-containing protein n=1 Tax=Flavihumibacter solisilvae TaxID=1349421 RepID=A0A0C1L6F7_9BACT|nr:hypothetical protein OI18_04500 [Flavihumibacter solisilvae]